jgi:antitoxin HicB
MVLEYAVHIERLAENDGGGYLATIPDLPGCMSDGDTPEEALKNVQEAIGSWIEAAKELRMEIPQPRPTLGHLAKEFASHHVPAEQALTPLQRRMMSGGA